MPDLEIVPRGPFSLDAAREFAGGFPAGIGGGGVGTASITLAFPVEGADMSVAAELWQDADGVVRGRTDASDELIPALVRQASRSLSLDHDGTGWPRVGDRDPVIGGIQREHDYLRPVCFYSAYEAATSFVIGQRISRRQSAVIKADLSDGLGDRPTVAGTPVAAFPRPARLLELREARGLNAEKVKRLHGLATAAIEGRLDANRCARCPKPRRWPSCRPCPAWGRSPRTACCIAAAASPMACPAATSSVARSSGTCTGSRAPRALTWSDSPRRGGRTGCGRSCCSGWRGPDAAARRSAIDGSAARPDGRWAIARDDRD